MGPEFPVPEGVEDEVAWAKEGQDNMCEECPAHTMPTDGPLQIHAACPYWLRGEKCPHEGSLPLGIEG